MKKSKRILTYSAVLTAAVSLSGCSLSEEIRSILSTQNFDPGENVIEDVYGPPIMEDWGDPEKETQFETDAAGVEQELFFDPQENVLEAVYGPPWMLGWGDGAENGDS